MPIKALLLAAGLCLSLRAENSYLSEYKDIVDTFLSGYETLHDKKLDISKFSLEEGNIPLDPDGSPVLGYCDSYKDGRRVMRVDPRWWKTLSPIKKEILIFHELGHCLLGKRHTKGGIMNENINVHDDKTYSEFRELFYWQLFF